jgi:gluconolactonase
MRRWLAGLLAVVLLQSHLSAQILPPGATPQLLAGGFRFTESPLFDRAGGVYFSDLDSTHVQSRLYRYDIAGHSTAVADPNSGGANGTYFNASGQMVSCDRDRRQISLRALGNIATVQQVLANQFNGTLFNGPNDLVVDKTGGVYFTDPDYENRQSIAEAAYYISPAGTLSRIVTGVARPNGIVLSPDGNTLYLAGWSGKFIRAYDVTAGGVITNPRQFASTSDLPSGPDGMTIDPAGNLYAALGTTVRAWNPSGQVVMNLSVPQASTNLDFGGPTGKTLFIAAGTGLYGIDLNIVPEPGGALAALALVSVVAGIQRRRKS